MNRSGANEVIRFIACMVFNHAVQVRNMLEVVGVNLTASQRSVRQNVILERFNLQIDPLLRQNRLSLLQNFRVGGIGRPHGERVRPGGKAQGA